jgi:HSP20 family protein
MLERKEKSSLLGEGSSTSQSRSQLGRESSELGRDQLGQGQVQSRSPREGRQNYPMAQMDRLFDEIFKRPFFSLWSHRMGGGEQEAEQQLFVPVDVFEDGESVIVRAEMPGIRKEDINVQLTPDTITITGEKRSESRVQEDNYYRMECSSGSFTRTCQLPAETLSDRARAVFKDGVLEVRIPKSLETRQRGRSLNIE